MEVHLNAGGSLRGEIKVPGDKSISHRALILGAIAAGDTEISDMLMGEDCLSTLKCLEKMGLQHSPVNAKSFSVSGLGLEGLKEPNEILDAGNSGTTMRLLMGLLAGQNFYSVISGDNSLLRRPMDRVTIPLLSMGSEIWGRAEGRLAPISIRGGNLKSISYKSPVASAQLKSAILLAALFAEGETSVKEPFISRDHTERMLNGFGVEINQKEKTVKIKGKQKLWGQKITVPGDISSAAFFLVAGAITPGSSILLQNIGINPTRTGLLDVLKQMGAKIKVIDQREVAGEPVGDILVEYSELHGIEISGEVIPRLIDEIPIIAIAATQAQGTTLIKDASELRIKESDRIGLLAASLKMLGAQVEELSDGIIIEGGKALKGRRLDCGGDHRMAMCLAIAAIVADGETIIKGAESVNISFPNFFDTLAILRK